MKHLKYSKQNDRVGWRLLCTRQWLVYDSTSSKLFHVFIVITVVSLLLLEQRQQNQQKKQQYQWLGAFAMNSFSMDDTHNSPSTTNYSSTVQSWIQSLIPIKPEQEQTDIVGKISTTTRIRIDKTIVNNVGENKNNNNDKSFPTSPIAVPKKYTIDDMICEYYEQPLNHYDLPVRKSGTYKQRYCYYNGFVTFNDDRNNKNDNSNYSKHKNKNTSSSSTTDRSTINDVPDTTSVLLYVGNESPLEQYINQTGLMWEIGYELHAQIIFIEHRYEGKSKPSPTIPNCMAYSSSIQALADYANFIEQKLFLRNVTTAKESKTTTATTTENESSSSKSKSKSSVSSSSFVKIVRPVVAFGGSYGGMLAAWIRKLYPNLIVGSIAASAPIDSFPLQVPNKIDSAFRVIYRALQYPYPPTSMDTTTTSTSTSNSNTRTRTTSATDGSTKENQEGNTQYHLLDDEHDNDTDTTAGPDPISMMTNSCSKNLLATWPLIKVLGTIKDGRELICRSLRLCNCVDMEEERHDDEIPIRIGTIKEEYIKKRKQQQQQQQFVVDIINWASSPWFDLAEGSYPYPSTYIPYALTHNDKAILPAWPLQAACWNASKLYMDYGIKFVDTNFSNVQYDIVYYDTTNSSHNNNYKNSINEECDDEQDGINSARKLRSRDSTIRDRIGQIHIDWDKAILSNDSSLETFVQSPTIALLFNAIRDAVSVWYNMTKDVQCYNVASAAPNMNNIRYSNNVNTNNHNGRSTVRRTSRLYRNRSRRNLLDVPQLSFDTATTVANPLLYTSRNRKNSIAKNATAQCERKMNEEGSWPSLCCNEPMNLIITIARGMGGYGDDNSNSSVPQEMYWPPSYPRGIKSYNDIIALWSNRSSEHRRWSYDHEVVDDDDDDDYYCPDPNGYYGYPQKNDMYAPDYQSILYDTTYGGGARTTRGVSSSDLYTNIIFSNGLLDPWSAGGVYLPGKDPTYCLFPFHDNHEKTNTTNNNSTTTVTDCPGLDPDDLIVPGLYVQNLSSSAIALIMEYGGHHTDLMYSNTNLDPPSIQVARQIEKQYIQKWINDFFEQ